MGLLRFISELFSFAIQVIETIFRILGSIFRLFSHSSNQYTDNKGYKRFNDSDKSVHRWAAEKKLGRKLRNGEVVHHKDRDKTNNSFGNLWVFKNQAEHHRVHQMDANRHGKKASYQVFKKKKGFFD
jgi:hypothetical protein